MWGIDFIVPFPVSHEYVYILPTVDYVSKGVEAVACRTNDNKVVKKFLKENILSRFGMPRAIISDNSTHFCNRSIEVLMRKYTITHKLSTLYHHQTSGQVEVSNSQIKQILEKTINQNRKDLLTLCGPTKQPTRLYGKCLHIGWHTERRVTFQLNLSIRLYGRYNV